MGLFAALFWLALFIGIFNVFTRICFGVGWCIWQLLKMLGIILSVGIIIILILTIIGTLN